MVCPLLLFFFLKIGLFVAFSLSALLFHACEFSVELSTNFAGITPRSMCAATVHREGNDAGLWPNEDRKLYILYFTSMFWELQY